MRAEILHDDGHQWIMFGRDPEKPDRIIDTNQYMIRHGKRALLLDPGGIELFAPMLAAVLKFVPPEDITDLFASHQDPDIISSLGLWDQVLGHATLHCSWIWEGFIRHFGMEHIQYRSVPDEGAVISLDSLELRLIPAHYLHSSGNFHVYDPRAKILFSGDVGAALEPVGAPLEVDDFEAHIPRMQTFHERWMPSNTAKLDWIRRVRQLDVKLMVPQHGRLFRGEAVGRFLDWFEQLEVGSALRSR
jgi:flavorubredoxin